jgi:hypothetical protein
MFWGGGSPSGPPPQNGNPVTPRPPSLSRPRLGDAEQLLGQHKLLFAIQVWETVEPGSLADLTARFPWSAVKLYDLNAPGKNAGLLLATWGWAPP